MNDDSATPPVPAKPPRLDSLDALRGFDLFALTFSFFYFYYFQLKKTFRAFFKKVLRTSFLLCRIAHKSWEGFCVKQKKNFDGSDCPSEVFIRLVCWFSFPRGYLAGTFFFAQGEKK